VPHPEQVRAQVQEISQSSLHRIEQGKQSVTLDTLENICDRLNCRLSEIF
jgi:DNA-binding Xre family transcriptional regulator